jgi:hypothetical protein
MCSQVHRENYLAALEVAHTQLHEIIRQFDGLQLRKEQIEDVVGALEPFLRSDQKSNYAAPHSEPHNYEFQKMEPVRVEPAHAEPIFAVPQPEAVQPILQVAPVHAAEPVRPAAFSPMPEPILDPIQNRINRALGLAVA